MIAQSSAASEYDAGASVASEILLLRDLMEFCGMPTRAVLLIDSAAAVGIAKR